MPNIEINTAGVMIKCTPSGTYMNVLNEMKSKNVRENVSVNVRENVSVKLNKTEKKVFDLISKNVNITINELADKLNLTERTIIRNTNTLKEKGLLNREGSDKNGHWKIL